MVTSGFDIYNGNFSYENTLANYVLSGAKAGKTLSQQLSIDAIYTGLTLGNDPNKSGRDVISEGSGKVSGSMVSAISSSLLDGKTNSVTKQAISSVIGSYSDRFTTDILKNNGKNQE